ncbi:DNA-3-methyladenine glycosylase 2 family protein [Halobacteriales archaeon QS_3_64_16]|nr:MAG: DNA-3-methyladenine glycosylase 2 family protein [Halobacteriales archaeon QS_3_64_16]
MSESGSGSERDNEPDREATPAEKVATLRSDPVLASAIDEHGILEVEPAADPFERMVTSIVNQQLSVASAAAIRERLFETAEITPEGILAADEAELRKCGLSASKVSYVKNVAEAFASGELSISDLETRSNEEIIEELTGISGIGNWTAKMALMFVFAREDVFPVEDLGIRNAIEAGYGEHTRAEMQELSTRWKPYRSLASLYLWRTVD